MQLIEPFPIAETPRLWEWLHEFPASNFDDYGPQTFPAFEEEMSLRIAHERTWVVSDGTPCGFIGFAPQCAHWGMLHGICFARRVHGTGIAQKAVREALAQIFSGNIEKASASFFASNPRIGRFLASLGAQDEGYMRAQTRQQGLPVDMRLVAFFKS